LGRDVYGARDPAALFVRRRPVRFSRCDGVPMLEIDLPSVPAEDVDVWVRGADLTVGVRDFERRIALPDSLAGLVVEGTHWREGTLEVRFAASGPDAP
jgi:hypothetical protein